MTHAADIYTRLPATEEPMRLPRRMADRPGMVIVDASWGRIQPIRLHPEIETIGELELIEHLRAGLPVFDCRRPEAFAAATIPGARSLPHTELEHRMHELDPQRATALFCGGPQCSATAHAVGILLAAGYPANMLRYYRGGMHDWMTLGLPTTEEAGGGSVTPSPDGRRQTVTTPPSGRS